jgi:hypothetical protein
MKQESNQDLRDRPSPALLTFAVFAVGWVAWGMLFYSGWFGSFFSSVSALIFGAIFGVPKLIAVAICALITLTLPLLVGWFNRFQFRLWHYFVWLTLIAMQLAWFSQI